jgi:hypothetical protein
MRALALSSLPLSVANNLRVTCVTPVKASLLLMVIIPLGGVVSEGIVVVVEGIELVVELVGLIDVVVG